MNKILFVAVLTSIAHAQYPNSANHGHTGGTEVESKQTIYFAASSGGTAQAQTASFTTAPTSLVDGMPLCWLPTAANTAAAPTFSPNGLTAHAIVKARQGALAANDILTTNHACVIYSATNTNWELQNPQTAIGVVARGNALSLGTSAIAANSCATAVTASAPGADQSTDAASWTPVGDISGVTGYGVSSTDGLIIYPYVITDNVGFRVCNSTSASITPGSVSINWKVLR